MKGNVTKQKPCVLIVEDDKENQKYLGLILKKNYDVEFCDSSKIGRAHV